MPFPRRRLCSWISTGDGAAKSLEVEWNKSENNHGAEKHDQPTQQPRETRPRRISEDGTPHSSQTRQHRRRQRQHIPGLSILGSCITKEPKRARLAQPLPTPAANTECPDPNHHYYYCLLLLEKKEYIVVVNDPESCSACVS